jgi:hypothetical protein
MLPHELIDHVFSLLRQDTSTLKACLEALPMYSRLAERHLFADIVVNPSTVSDLYKQLSGNPHILNYPRTFVFRHRPLLHVPNPESDDQALSIMSMMPRMVNLTSLSLSWGRQYTIDLFEQFVPILKNCLEQSFIEVVRLYNFNGFPLSVLDKGRSIKKLTLVRCTAMEESVSSSGSSSQTLKTLTIAGLNDGFLISWTTHRIGCLTSLELEYDREDRNSTAIRELLRACSNSLTTLYFKASDQCMPNLCFFSQTY